MQKNLTENDLSNKSKVPSNSNWQRSKRRKSYTPLTTALLVLGDMLTLGFAFLSAYWMRFYSGIFPVYKGIPSAEQYSFVFPFVCLVFLYMFKTARLYRKRERFSLLSVIGKVIRAVSLSFFILMAMHFLYRGDVPFSRAFVLIAWGFSILFLSFERGVANQMELWINSRRKDSKRVVLIGMGDSCRRMIKGIEADRRLEFKVMGVVSTQPTEETYFANKSILGHLGEIQKVLTKHQPDVVILSISSLEHKQIVDLILACEKSLVRFYLVPDLFEILTTQVHVTNLSGVPLLGLKDIPLANGWNRLVKRCFDIAGALFGIIISAPVFLTSALLIKFDSKGPLFYKQTRCGEDGRTFDLYKFRTMKEDAEKETGPVWASEKDPRRTKIGGFLRNLNWDELPQLMNVLKGDMSLVGPRPERPHFVEQFKEDIPRYMSRHQIRSGMTGWAQVNGLRGNTDIRQRIKYDLYYIENWSLLLDVKILILTLFMGNKNAY